MRDFMLRMGVCLVVLCGLAADPAGAAQRTQQRKIKGNRPGQTEAYSLDDIMKSPKEYIEREVMFYARFATTANLFKQINTRFNANSHVNLAVWPDKSVLWTEEGRKNVLPTLYILKNDAELIAGLKEIKKYELVAVTGQVQNVYAGYPWILISKLEKVEKPSEHLDARVIEHMESGYASLDAGSGGAAARHFEQALQFGLPVEYRDSAYRQLAQAYLMENKLDRARGYLRQAVEMNRDEPRLHLALADVCLQMYDPGEALAHATIALELSGKFPQAYGIRGESLSLLGDYAKAFNDLNTAAGTPGITPREKAIIQLRRARIYSRSDRPTDAARIYAAVSEPGEELSADANVHNEIGLFYEKLFLQSGDAAYLDSAVTAFGEAANLATLNPIFLYNQAEAEFRRQRFNETPDMGKVLEILEKINRIDPDYAPARLLLGRVYFQQENLTEAEAIYQSVAPHLGNDSMALLALAEAYIDLARYEDALVAVRSAREAQPWNRRLQALGGQIENIAAGRLELALAEQAAEEARLQAEAAASAAQEAAAQAATAAREAADKAAATAEEAAARAKAAQSDADAAASEAEAAEDAAEEAGPDAVSYDKYYLDEFLDEEDSGAFAEPMAARSFKPFAAEPVEEEPVAAAGTSFRAPGAHPLRPPAAPAVVVAPTVVATESKPAHEPLNLDQNLDNDLVAFDAPVMYEALQNLREAPRSSPSAMREPSGAKRERLPMTRVELPAEIVPVAGSGVVVPSPLDLGYTPGNNKQLLPELITEEFAEEFGGEFAREGETEWKGEGMEREAGVDSDGYLQFGMRGGDAAPAISGIVAAYASISSSSVPVEDGDTVRIPPVFTFDPDTSPVILADIRSKAVPGRKQLVRNANLYRRHDEGGRRPAEIIERDPVSPHTARDAAAMMGPTGAETPRAEVRLPSSSLGIGRVKE